MCKSVPTIATLSVPIKRYIATCPILINYWKARDCAFIHSWSQFIHSQTKWWKHTLFTFYFFGDISKVCIKFAWQLDGMGWGGSTGLFVFVSTALLSGSLARCLPGSSTPVWQTDDDDDSHRGCSSLPPVHPTVAVRGAGAENGEQRERSEKRDW